MFVTWSLLAGSYAFKLELETPYNVKFFCTTGQEQFLSVTFFFFLGHIKGNLRNIYSNKYDGYHSDRGVYYNLIMT